MTAPSQALKLTASAALLSLLLAGGCHKKQPTNTAGSGVDGAPGLTSDGVAPTATLTADPLTIEQGASVVLNWRTTNATSVTIDGLGTLPVNGTQTVSPANSTNFHLVAKGDGGTVESNVRVTVLVAQPPTTGNTTGQVADTDTNGAAMGSAAEFAANVQDVFYDYDSFDLRPDAVTAAANAARYLNAHPAIRVLVAGYCDDRGSAEYNITLGENRANAAKTALVNAGVSASRLRVVSYGKERQFCTEDNESCWQENRRAQFTLDR